MLIFASGSPTVFVGDRSGLVAIVGGDINHGCVYQGFDLGEIFWTLDGSTSILQDPRVDIGGFQSGSGLFSTSISILNIINIDLNFTGELTCSVVDGDGNMTSTSFNLTVLCKL